MASQIQSLAAVFLLGGTLLLACSEATPNYCQKNGDCTGGRVCDVARGVCVSPDSAVGAFDGPNELDGVADVKTTGEVGVAGDVPYTYDISYEVSMAQDAPMPIDGSMPADVPMPIDSAGDEIDSITVDVQGPDLYVPDGAGTCGNSGDCSDPTRAFCVGGLCVGCQGTSSAACGAQVCDIVSGKCVECTTDVQCTKDPAKAFCVANGCTGCSTAGAAGCVGRTDGKTVCAATGQCVECTADAQCTNDPTKAFCVLNACTGCNTTGATGCAGRTNGKSVCAGNGECVECTADAQCTKVPSKAFCVLNACTGCNTTGAAGCSARTDGKTVCAADGECVECTGDTQCTKDSTKAFCVANACTGCSTAGATGCSARPDGKTVCATTGQCVECTVDTQCTKDSTKAFCVANACAGCQLAAANACSSRAAAKPVCGTTGVCVECNISTDCAVMTKPICTSNACGACTADDQCIAKLGANPGVCMNHEDGHCATNAETVYVGMIGTATCSDSNSGTVTAPVCSAQVGIGTAKTNAKRLIVVNGSLAAGSTTVAATLPLTIVGKSSAKLTPTTGSDGISINSGEIFLRGLTVQGTSTSGVGINAAPTGGNTVTLRMDTCVVSNNPGGGILLNGAAFDIKNTSITGNGPGTAPGSGASYGGIRIEALPTSGPTVLNLVTIQNNKQVGLSCSGAGAWTGPVAGLLVSGNTGGDIGTTCGVNSCSSSDGGATCGAQTTP